MSSVNNVRLAELWPFMKEQLEAGKTVRFAPRGTSMLPMLRQGVDSVVLKSAPARLEKYDLPLYLRKSGQFVLHRVVALEKDGYTMCGDNQCVREYGVKHNEILAVATGFYRGDVYVDCNDLKYRKYCARRVRRQWVRSYFVRFKQIVKKTLKHICKIVK